MSLSLFNILRFPMSMLPMLIATMVQVRAPLWRDSNWADVISEKKNVTKKPSPKYLAFLMARNRLAQQCPLYPRGKFSIRLCLSTSQTFLDQDVVSESLSFSRLPDERVHKAAAHVPHQRGARPGQRGERQGDRGRDPHGAGVVPLGRRRGDAHHQRVSTYWLIGGALSSGKLVTRWSCVLGSVPVFTTLPNLKCWLRGVGVCVSSLWSQFDERVV